MKELVFVGLGLNDERGISLRGLDEVKDADNVFIELYTNILPEFSIQRLRAITGKNIQILSRHDLEDENALIVLKAAETGKTVFLVPGDPFIATTHVTMRLEANKRRIKTRVIHGASIISAIIGLSGLHNYKFGKTVTVPFPENFSATPYNVVTQNKVLGLHTLCLLDINAVDKRYLTINEALSMLRKIELEKNKKSVADKTVAVGLARVGSNNSLVKAGFVEELLSYDFGAPPHSLVIPGRLHFMEAEALITFAGAPITLRSMAR